MALLPLHARLLRLLLSDVITRWCSPQLPPSGGNGASAPPKLTASVCSSRPRERLRLWAAAASFRVTPSHTLLCSSSALLSVFCLFPVGLSQTGDIQSYRNHCYSIMLFIILNTGYIYRFLQIPHVIDMICLIRHSHQLASLSDYVTLMIVFYLKAISNMKCLLPFQGTLFSYFLSITGGILHDVSVSQHQLSTVSSSLPRGKAEFGPERLGGHPRHHGSFKTFLPWATWAPGAVRLLHWHRGDSQWVNVFIPIQPALYVIKAWVLFHAGWQSFQLTAASNSCH